MRAAVSAGLALFLAAVPSGEVHAQGEMSVSVEGCSMRGAEVTRLVQLELSSVLVAGVDPSSYRVAIRCEGPDLHLSLFDPLTQKSLARTVVAPDPAQPEPERLVALTVAQLYRAAWLELGAGDPAPLVPSPAEERPSGEIASARRAAERLVGERPSPGKAGDVGRTGAGDGQASKAPTSEEAESPASAWPAVSAWSFGVALGARARHAEAPLVLPVIEATATWAPIPRGLWVLVYTGMEWTDVTRRTGVLETLLVRGGAGVGMQPVAWGRWSTFVEAAGGVTYLSISGVATDVAYAGRHIGGAGLDVSVAVGLAARIGPVRFGLVGRAGVLAGTPAGIVAGDEDLSLDGLWGGGELRFDGLW